MMDKEINDILKEFIDGLTIVDKTKGDRLLTIKGFVELQTMINLVMDIQKDRTVKLIKEMIDRLTIKGTQTINAFDLKQQLEGLE